MENRNGLLNALILLWIIGAHALGIYADATYWYAGRSAANWLLGAAVLWFFHALIRHLEKGELVAQEDEEQAPVGAEEKEG